MGVKFQMQVAPDRASKCVQPTFSEDVKLALIDQYNRIRAMNTAEESEKIFMGALESKKDKLRALAGASRKIPSGRKNVAYNPFDWAVTLMKEALDEKKIHLVQSEQKMNTSKRNQSENLAPIPEIEECPSDVRSAIDDYLDEVSEDSDESEIDMDMLKALFRSKGPIEQPSAQKELQEILDDALPSFAKRSLITKGIKREEVNDWCMYTKGSFSSSFSFIDDTLMSAKSLSIKYSGKESMISNILGNFPYGYTASSFDTRFSKSSISARQPEEATRDDCNERKETSNTKRETSSWTEATTKGTSNSSYFSKVDSNGSSSSSNSWVEAESLGSVSTLSGDTARGLRVHQQNVSKAKESFISGEFTVPRKIGTRSFPQKTNCPAKSPRIMPSASNDSSSIDRSAYDQLLQEQIQKSSSSSSSISKGNESYKKSKKSFSSLAKSLVMKRNNINSNMRSVSKMI